MPFCWITFQCSSAKAILWNFSLLFFCSCYAYLERRYNSQVRRIASSLFFIYVVIMCPLIIYTPALAFSQVSGINLHYITPILVFVCVFYTTFGGLRWVGKNFLTWKVLWDKNSKNKWLQSCRVLWRATIHVHDYSYLCSDGPRNKWSRRHIECI